MSILPRPLRLSRAWIAGSVLWSVVLILLGCSGVIGPIMAFTTGEWWACVTLVMTVLIDLGIRELRKVGEARLLAADCEEVVGRLVLQEDRSMRDQHGMVHHWRDYRLLVDGVDVPHSASARVDRPLFLDEAHTQALCVRSKSQPHVIMVVRNDLKPFAVSDAEYRALRERIEELREVSA